MQKLSAFRTLEALISQNLYPQALKLSVSLNNSPLTNTIYAFFVKSCARLDPFLAASLITHFSLSGKFSRATYLLHNTHNPDTVVFNSLICGYARVGQLEPAFELFNGLRNLGLKPDAYTASGLIKCCGTLMHNEIVHGVCVKTGFVERAFLVSGLVENYSRNGLVESAEKCFDGCLDLDCVVWTALINGYVLNGKFEKGKAVFMEMMRLGFKANEFSLSSVVGGVFEINEGQQIHGFGVKMGYLCGCSNYLNNALMSYYCRCGCKIFAVKLFEEIPEPDVVSWTGRIGAACDGLEALNVFKCCISGRFGVNEYTLINVLAALNDSSMLEVGKQIHVLCYKTGCLVVSSVCNALIFMYGKSGEMGNAKDIFYEMSFRDSVSWNSLINGYAENFLAIQAIEAFSRMRHSLIQPNEYTLASIFEVLANTYLPEPVMQIHSLMIKLGFMTDDSMLSCLITAYGKCNVIDGSKKVFNDIDKVDVIHVNAMTSAFDNCGCYTGVLNLFQTRWNLSLEVDSVNFSIVLKACGALSDLNQGRSVHSLALKFGTSTDKFVESAIIDVYNKCGSINEAENAFRDISTDNLAAWNAMLMGYAQFGYYDKVNDLFSKMVECGVEPDEITYLGVLSSCCHAGLVNEARHHLNSMLDLHGVTPSVQHYSCMVDVLGRVGLLEDAKKTIDEMPLSPDARIWQILLSACNVHGNIDLGIVAASKVLELQPENDAAFVLLSNIYASAGMWNAAGELRRVMEEKIVSKEAGSSWIQVQIPGAGSSN